MHIIFGGRILFVSCGRVGVPQNSADIIMLISGLVRPSADNCVLQAIKVGGAVSTNSLDVAELKLLIDIES